MKRFIAALLILFVPALGFGATIDWNAPATYVNGDPVGPAELARVEYHLYADMVEFAVVGAGATHWEGDLPQAVGETKSYTATAVLDGVPSDHSAPTIFVYIVPLSPPANILIQMK